MHSLYCSQDTAVSRTKEYVSSTASASHRAEQRPCSGAQSVESASSLVFATSLAIGSYVYDVDEDTEPTTVQSLSNRRAPMRMGLDGHAISSESDDRRPSRHTSPAARSETPLEYHYCYNCGRPRSKSFHQANPPVPGRRPIPGICSRCLPATVGKSERKEYEGAMDETFTPPAALRVNHYSGYKPKLKPSTRSQSAEAYRTEGTRGDLRSHSNPNRIREHNSRPPGRVTVRYRHVEPSHAVLVTRTDSVPPQEPIRPERARRSNTYSKLIVLSPVSTLAHSPKNFHATSEIRHSGRATKSELLREPRTLREPQEPGDLSSPSEWYFRRVIRRTVAGQEDGPQGRQFETMPFRTIDRQTSAYNPANSRQRNARYNVLGEPPRPMYVDEYDQYAARRDRDNNCADVRPGHVMFAPTPSVIKAARRDKEAMNDWAEAKEDQYKLDHTKKEVRKQLHKDSPYDMLDGACDSPHGKHMT